MVGAAVLVWKRQEDETERRGKGRTERPIEEDKVKMDASVFVQRIGREIRFVAWTTKGGMFSLLAEESKFSQVRERFGFGRESSPTKGGHITLPKLDRSLVGFSRRFPSMLVVANGAAITVGILERSDREQLGGDETI
jgi:hypothetical protein